MLSYWEQQSLLQYDSIIIGSGIVGLHTAIELKEKHPGSRVLLLDRSLLPYGASTRNAGFACMGSLTELLDDLEHMTEDQMVQLFTWRQSGLALLRQRLGDEHISYRQNGSYELLDSKSLDALAAMDRINGLLAPVTGTPAFRLANEKIKDFGFGRNQVKAVLEHTAEGELHTGKMMRRLMDLAIQCGVEIKTGATATRFEEEDHQVIVDLSDPSRKENIPLSCRQLFICTNAFTKQLLPHIDLNPGRGQVLLTEPVADLNWKGIFHFDKGYYYFRELEGRVLFGGGRQLDIPGETTTELELRDEIQADLEDKLRHFILPGKPVTIAQRWAGIMAFGPHKQPLIQAYGTRVFGAFRLGGMGVALGAWAAKELVRLSEN